MDVTDDAQGPLDPRIQIELENLNTATDDINKLEIELDEAETSFKHWQSESLKKLIGIMNKIGGGHIEKARCYYDALKSARQAQLQSQHQAHLFERANQIHATAKETVALAEAKFISHKHEWNFDQAWQDMLNHATIKVRDAEHKKAICGREHQIKTMLFEEANKKVQQLEDKYRRAIVKARPFFDQHDIYEQEVSTQRAKISCLEKAIKEAKRAYSHSFRALEEISNEIHQQRRDYVMMVSGPREPGVGAELMSSEENINYGAKQNSIMADRNNAPASGDGDSNSHGSSQDNRNVSELEDHVENIGGRSVDGRESTSDQWELELQASLEKLNTLTFRDQNWDSQIKTVNLSTSPNSSSDKSSDCQSNMTVTSSILDQAMQNDYIRSKKLPVNFQISIEKRNISLNSGDGIDNNYGWQSLTQSPINSIKNRCKMGLTNDVSKSLNHSPVNVRSSFSRTETETNLRSANNSHDATIIINSNIFNDVTLLKNNQKDSNNTNDNTKLVVPMKNNETTSSSTLNEDEKQLYDNVDNENGNYSDINNSSSNCLNEHHALNEKYDNHQLDTISGIKFVDNPKFKKASCKISSIRELPLLSMFATSIKLQTSKDRSCSLINLSEKQNLKSLLDNSPKGNIRAISVEKLANARHVLMSKHIDTESDF